MRNKYSCLSGVKIKGGYAMMPYNNSFPTSFIGLLMVLLLYAITAYMKMLFNVVLLLFGTLT